MVSPVQLDVELVKVEVVVMTEDEQEEVEETVIGQTMSLVEQETSNESSALGGEECSITPVILEVDRSDAHRNTLFHRGDTFVIISLKLSP